MNPWKRLLSSGKLVVVTGIWDGFSARFAQAAGFEGLMLGGHHIGAVVGAAEALITASETVEACRVVKRATTIPLRVDGGAGYGDTRQVVRLIKDLKMIGVEGVSLADDVYPRGSPYYKDEVIPLPDMLDKIRWAKRAAGEEMLVVGRTESYKSLGASEGLRRCLAFLEAGADAVQAFPNNLEEARELPGKIPGPVWISNGRGNSAGRPILTPRQAQEFGYAALGDGHVLWLAAYAGMRAAVSGFSFDEGWPPTGDEIALRKGADALLNLGQSVEEQR